MTLLVTILIGLAVGVMVELLLPGHTPSELVLAVFLGIAGALVARIVGEQVGWYQTYDPESYIGCLVGAVVVLLLYGLVFRRRPKKA